MPNVLALLSDVDSRYRNTYTQDQKIAWMDMVHKQIFQIVRHESIPFTFTTIANQSFYVLPDDCDPKGIEQITIETDVGSGKYTELDYQSKEEEAENEFYTVIDRNIFLYPMPDSTTVGKNVYLYYNKRPATLTSSSVPDLEESFHELLVLGTLSRIAAARKDAVMKNNYDSDFQMLLDDYQFMNKMTDPQFLSPNDVLPKIRRSW